MTTATKAVTWGALGALIPVVLGIGLLIWQGGALADQVPRQAAVLEDHEARLRELEMQRAALAELQADVRWIRHVLEQQTAVRGGPACPAP